MNLAIIVLAVTGYLIVTAKGQPLGIFDWFNIPALTQLTVSTSDLVSKLHLWSAYFIIAIASIHALAALKHHFINKDATLRRMLNL
jgi:cytochrome b561